MTDPTPRPADLNDDIAADIRAFANAWEVGHPSETVLAGGNADVPYLFIDQLNELLDEHQGHRARQIEAEQALTLLLLREGGRTEFTPAEMTRAPADGSFVSSRNAATGNEVLEFVAARGAARLAPVPTAVCGVRIPTSSAKNLGADPATTCARIPNHTEVAHVDAAGDVMWIDRKAPLEAAAAPEPAPDSEDASTLADRYYSLMASVECVLIDHLDNLWGPGIDANLAELGNVWQTLTSLGGPQDIQVALARNDLPACHRCNIPFDDSDRTYDGHARFVNSPWCRECVEHCHDSEDAGHRCAVCQDEAAAGRMSIQTEGT